MRSGTSTVPLRWRPRLAWIKSSRVGAAELARRDGFLHSTSTRMQGRERRSAGLSIRRACSRPAAYYFSPTLEAITHTSGSRLRGIAMAHIRVIHQRE